MNNINKQNNTRIILLSKLLLFLFLIMYSTPLFLYGESSDLSLIIFFSIVYFTVIFFFLFYKNSIYSSQDYLPISFNIIPSLVIILFLYFFIWFNTRGNFVALFNRNTRESDFIQGNLYVIVDILLRVIFCKLIISVFSSANSSKNKILVTGLLLFSFFFDIAYLGARRTSIFIFMVFLWVFLPKISKKKLVFSVLALLIIGIINFLFSGYRELIYAGYSGFGLTETIAASFFTNEFQLVSENFLLYQKYAHLHGFGFGSTILETPLILIPRFIWENKPQTIDKVTGIFPNLLGELYYNFGYSLIIFLTLYFYGILRFIKKNKHYGVFVFALIPEVFRTTVSAFIFSVFLYFVIDYIVSRCFKIKFF